MLREAIAIALGIAGGIRINAALRALSWHVGSRLYAYALRVRARERERARERRQPAALTILDLDALRNHERDSAA